MTQHLSKKRDFLSEKGDFMQQVKAESTSFQMLNRDNSEEDDIVQPPSKRSRITSTGSSEEIGYNNDNDETDSESSDSESSSSGSSSSDSSEDEQESNVEKQQIPVETGHENLVETLIEKLLCKNDIGLENIGQENSESAKPIDAQTGACGLSLNLNGSDLAAEKWSPEMENIKLRETIKFLSNRSSVLEIITYDELLENSTGGPKKLTIDDENNFCDQEMLKKLLAKESIFENVDKNGLESARLRSNAFQTIERTIFLNQSAVKMANLDFLFHFMFTNPLNEDGTTQVNGNDLLYFADVCAGTGGFSEYILWRKKWQCKGFSFTLKSANDFQLEKNSVDHSETLDTFNGIREDGNIYDPNNIESFTNYVLKQTTNGVHFMMSDASDSVESKEIPKEIQSKQLYLCQCLTALSVVRDGGHFITKVFDLFTPFSVGLVFLMYKSFRQICIVKPNTSYPGDSERYLVCKWKKSNTKAIRQFLFDMNVYLFEHKNATTDIKELVPVEIMKDDKHFFNYIYDSNNSIAENQVNASLKLAFFYKNKHVKDERQNKLRCDSLAMWNIPNENRALPVKPILDNLLRNMLANWYPEKNFMVSFERQITASTYKETFFDKTDWVFVPIEAVENNGNAIRTFFLSNGKSDVYKYTNNETWEKLSEIHVEITANTLFYGEIVKEITGDGNNQSIVYAMHIIDAMVLGGMDIRNVGVEKRNQFCQQFARSHNKPQKLIQLNNRGVYTSPIRCKIMHPLHEIRRFFDSMIQYNLKGNLMQPGLPVNDTIHSKQFYIPHGLMIFKIMKPNLCKQFDHKIQDYFYTDLFTKQNFILKNIPNPNDLFGSFKSTFSHRKLWKWTDPLQVVETFNNAYRKGDLLYRSDLEKFIYKN